jgi:thioredoxin reductase
LLLATGRLDVVPCKPGFRTFYGRGVYHCPFCDGWEHRDQQLGVYGKGVMAAELALELLTWSSNVTIYSDGRPVWSEEESTRLKSAGIRVVNSIIRELAGGETLQSICFDAWDPAPCDALFFCEDCPQKSSLPEKLGCSFDVEGAVRCEGFAAAGVSGLYVAGNVRGGVHLAIIAAAEGAEAALVINEALAEAGMRASNPAIGH